jgi:hypothetical protein
MWGVKGLYVYVHIRKTLGNPQATFIEHGFNEPKMETKR